MSTAGVRVDGRGRLAVWTTWVVASLLLLDVFGGWAYLFVVTGLAVVVILIPGMIPARHRRRDHAELAAMGSMYLVVVALLSLAFRGFGTANTAGLFLTFAAALLVGVIGPIYYTVWRREGSLGDLGLRAGNRGQTATLALLFAGVQFWLTVWRLDLPTPEDWVPLLVMALVVGVFEAIFFRGFLQSRLEEQFGSVAGVFVAAMLYGGYHVGYGMGLSELGFLTGLGLVYAVAFALPRSVFVLWPLLTPLGSFYNGVTSGDIDLPWASIIGFAEVFIVMLALMGLARRHTTRRLPAGLSREVAPRRRAISAV
jgi:membrane protease YdiL (CAAX protease family)